MKKMTIISFPSFNSTPNYYITCECGCLLSIEIYQNIKNKETFK